MRSIITQTLLSFALAGLVLPSHAWAVTTTEGSDTGGSSSSPAQLDDGTARTFCSQAARGAVVSLPGGSVITLNACSTSTISATDIGTTTPTPSKIPVAGTDSHIALGWIDWVTALLNYIPWSAVEGTGTNTSTATNSLVHGGDPRLGSWTGTATLTNYATTASVTNTLTNYATTATLTNYLPATDPSVTNARPSTNTLHATGGLQFIVGGGTSTVTGTGTGSGTATGTATGTGTGSVTAATTGTQTVTLYDTGTTSSVQTVTFTRTGTVAVVSVASATVTATSTISGTANATGTDTGTRTFTSTATATAVATTQTTVTVTSTTTQTGTWPALGTCYSAGCNPGGAPCTVLVGEKACGGDNDWYLCTAGGWSYDSASCAVVSYRTLTATTTQTGSLTASATSSGTATGTVTATGTGTATWTQSGTGTASSAEIKDNPTIAAVVGTTAGTLAAGDDARFTSGPYANKSLSNLTNPTAINQALLPDSYWTLGSSTQPWGYSYLLDLWVGTPPVSGFWPARIAADGSAEFSYGVVHLDSTGIATTGTFQAQHYNIYGHGDADLLLPGALCTAGQVLTYLSTGAPTCVTNGSGTGIGCSGGSCSSPNWAVWVDSTHIGGHAAPLLPNSVSCTNKTKVIATNGQITSCTDATASDVGAVPAGAYLQTISDNFYTGPSSTVSTDGTNWTTLVSTTVSAGASQSAIVRGYATMQATNPTVMPCTLRITKNGTPVGVGGQAGSNYYNYVQTIATAKFTLTNGGTDTILLQMYSPLVDCTAPTNYASLEVIWLQN